jgi:type II secretory pathway pseudopilin PulG
MSLWLADNDLLATPSLQRSANGLKARPNAELPNANRPGQHVPLRPGVTLTELLVVFALIAVLVGLMLPAVQRVREASRRMACSNHLHQIGIAMQHYETAWRSLPWGAKGGWGHSWTIDILPQLEQSPVYRMVPYSEQGWWDGADPESLRLQFLARQVQPFYRCPSQPGESTELRSVNGIEGRAIGNYMGSMGGNVRVDNASTTLVDPFRGDGVLQAADFQESETPKPPIRFRSIIDGLSHTMLIGEGTYHVDETCGICDRFIHYHPNFDSGAGFDFSEVLGSAYYPFNESGSEAKQELSFGSFHPTGLHLLRCDGSVTFASESIETRVRRALASRQQQEVIDGTSLE